jgi:hypothetical protein
MRNRVVSALLLGAVLASLAAAGPFASFFVKDTSVKELLEAPHATQPCGLQQAGFCILPASDGRGGSQLKVEPYYPMPGDILLYDSLDKVVATVMKLAGTGGPSHAAMVIARREGTPAILEVGPNSRPQAFTKCYIVEVYPRLSTYPGSIYVRRPHQPLNQEQSQKLTEFAEAQIGKEFAVGRLALQMTPFRCRFGLRHTLFAGTVLNRDRWVCSENVVAAGTVAGLFDPKVHFANAMYPRDLAYDEEYNLTLTYGEPVLWVPTPSVRIEGNRVMLFKSDPPPGN